MDKSSIVALVFLVLGGLFVGSLLKSLFKLIGMVMQSKDDLKLDSSYLLKLFSIPLLSFAALMIFVIFVLPKLS